MLSSINFGINFKPHTYIHYKTILRYLDCWIVIKLVEILSESLRLPHVTKRMT